MKAARVKQGSVVWNRRFKTWNFLWIQDGRRRSKVIGTLRDFPTKEGATQAAEALRHALHHPRDGSVPTVRFLVREFRREKMPERFSTRLGYEAWLKNHILPRWGGCVVTAMQARPVELWLNTLPVSPKSRSGGLKRQTAMPVIRKDFGHLCLSRCYHFRTKHFYGN